MKLLKRVSLLALLTLTVQIITAQEALKSSQFIIGGTTNLLIQNNTYPTTGLAFLSGIGGIYSNNTNETKNISFAFSPYTGMELNKRWLVGLQFDYRAGKYTSRDIQIFGQAETFDLKRDLNQIGAGLFARYVLNTENELQFFLQPHFEINLISEKESHDSALIQKEKAQLIELGLSPGFKYQINKNFNALLSFGGLNYINGNWQIAETDTQKNFNSFGFNFSSSAINLGLEVKL